MYQEPLSGAAVRLFLGEKPSLDHDVWIDSCPDKDQANAVADTYANLLVRNGLADRFGVSVRRLDHLRRVGGKDVATDTFDHGDWAIFVGPHEEALAG